MKGHISAFCTATPCLICDRPALPDVSTLTIEEMRQEVEGSRIAFESLVHRNLRLRDANRVLRRTVDWYAGQRST